MSTSCLVLRQHLIIKSYELLCIHFTEEYYHDNKPFDDGNTVVTNQPQPGSSSYAPGQWSSPPDGPYSTQPGPGPGYPQGAGYQGQSVPHGQFGTQNSPMPSAPPEEHEYLPPTAPAGYPEPPPPYQVDDPHPT